MLQTTDDPIERILTEVPPAPFPDSERVVRTTNGASALVAEQEGQEQLEVRDPAGRLLFRYDAVTGRGVLSIPDGDLELEAPRGDLVLRSGRDVRIDARGEIGLRGPRLDLEADRADLHVVETHFDGRTLDATLETVRLCAERIQTIAGRIIERALNVYRHVQKLHQLKSGRVRTLASGAIHMKSDAVFVKADGDVKLDGQQIHLG